MLYAYIPNEFDDELNSVGVEILNCKKNGA